jgi:hypothetical protein
MGTVVRLVVLVDDDLEETTMHSLLDLALAGQLHRDRSAVTLTRSHLRLRDLLSRHPHEG